MHCNNTPQVIEGRLNAKDRHFSIVVARFNDFVTTKLLEGAVDCIVRHDGARENIQVIKVPGAFEIPLAADRAALRDETDCVICLGAVIRGATPHFDYVAAEAAKGAAAVSLKRGKPVIFGVLTCDTLEQALERAGTKAGNKGWDAALSAIEMVNLMAQI
jgi:6,7-dimethyl-8-ribityllumazine synthase